MDMLAFFGSTVLFLGSTLVVLLLPLAMVRLARARRGQYLAAAVAIWAWALWAWAGMAATYPALRDGLGSVTLLALQGVAVFIVVLLVLRITQVAWNWPKGPLWFARLIP